MQTKKTKEKDASKLVPRQRNSTETMSTLCWKDGISDITDGAVEMMGSGSISQEIFMVYAYHFVSTLLNSEPLILFSTDMEANGINML